MVDMINASVVAIESNRGDSLSGEPEVGGAQAKAKSAFRQRSKRRRAATSNQQLLKLKIELLRTLEPLRIKGPNLTGGEQLELNRFG